MIHNLTQRTSAWHQIRLGKVTGSRMKTIFSSNNLPLIYELIAEEISQSWDETYVSAAMQRGIDLEPLAREAYCYTTGREIHDFGFITSDELPYIGVSPDGATSDLTHAIEIKCPDTKNHVAYLATRQLPKEYQYQALTYFIAIPQLQSLDFVSYDPRFSIKALHILTITREEMQLPTHLPEILKFREKWLKYLRQICF
ncbi:MAG: exo [Bacteroidetes bacterium]|nr:MAG: exo [Bacteroidota bacterium]